MPHVPLYDRFSEEYDRFVEWKGRLAYEWPFLDGRLRQVDARRVLDVACGTGQHSVALAAAGYEAVGVDLSEGMIEAARRNAQAVGSPARFAVAGFGDLAARLDGPFDALLCLGNSLPHALSADLLRAALRDFRQVLRPGGLLIVQNRNFDQVCASRQRFMPPQSHRAGDDQEWVYVRFYDFPDTVCEPVTFQMLTLHRQGAQWSQSVESTTLRPILHAELEIALEGAGFSQPAFYGALAEEPFDPLHSGNLVAVAQAG